MDKSAGDDNQRELWYRISQILGRLKLSYPQLAMDNSDLLLILVDILSNSANSTEKIANLKELSTDLHSALNDLIDVYYRDFNVLLAAITPIVNNLIDAQAKIKAVKKNNKEITIALSQKEKTQIPHTIREIYFQGLYLNRA